LEPLAHTTLNNPCFGNLVTSQLVLIDSIAWAISPFSCYSHRMWPAFEAFQSTSQAWKTCHNAFVHAQETPPQELGWRQKDVSQRH